MRQDAARSIVEQLSRPDTSGAAGFRQNIASGLRRALDEWERKNDAIPTKYAKYKKKHWNQMGFDEKPAATPRRKAPEKPALSAEEIQKQKDARKELVRIKNEKAHADKLASMTPEELDNFRKRSERMKKFRKELKERKQQTEQ